LAAVFFLVSYFFVYQSFYGMRIRGGAAADVTSDVTKKP
jgi:hypothetical protein